MTRPSESAISGTENKADGKQNMAMEAGVIEALIKETLPDAQA